MRNDDQSRLESLVYIESLVYNRPLAKVPNTPPPTPPEEPTVYTQVEKRLIFHSSLVYLEHKLYMGMLLVEAEPPIWH